MKKTFIFFVLGILPFVGIKAQTLSQKVGTAFSYVRDYASKGASMNLQLKKRMLSFDTTIVGVAIDETSGVLQAQYDARSFAAVFLPVILVSGPLPNGANAAIDDSSGMVVLYQPFVQNQSTVTIALEFMGTFCASLYTEDVQTNEFRGSVYAVQTAFLNYRRDTYGLSPNDEMVAKIIAAKAISNLEAVVQTSQ